MSMKAARDEFQQRQHMLLEDFEIYHYRDEEELHVSLHFHDFYECYYLLSGQVAYQIESRSYTLAPGELLLISPNQLHRPQISDAVPYERIVLWIARPFIEELSSDASDLTRAFSGVFDPARYSKSQRAAVGRMLSALLAASKSEGFGAELLRRALMTELLVELGRAADERLHAGMTSMTGIAGMEGMEENALVKRVCDYLDAHLAEQITLDGLAASVYLSKYYLSRAFRDETGVTIFEMLTQRRMMRARDLMSAGVPLLSVAEQCGYADYSGFYRAFVQEYGVSPREYIRPLL